MSQKILVVGLACVDIINVVDDYPKEDSDQRVLDYYWQRGGNAANTSCVLSLLGADVEFLGAFSCDKEAEKWPEITYENFKKLDLSQYKWIHFEGRPCCDDIKRCLAWIDDYNISVESPLKVITSVEIEKTNRPELDDLFDKSDVVFVSKDYVRSRGYSNKEEGLKNLYSRCKEGSELICAWGEEGAVAMDTNHTLHSSPAYPPDLQPGETMETLAAGDTFNAAFIMSRSRGHTLSEALTFGCQVAGAKCGMKGLDGLKKFNVL